MKRVVEYRINLTELYERTLQRKMNYVFNTPINEIANPELSYAARELGDAIRDWIGTIKEDTKRLREEIGRYKGN